MMKPEYHNDDSMRVPSVIVPTTETRTFVVPCPHGIHLRIAARLVTIAQQFQSEVWLRAGSIQVDAKSILHVMELRVRQGVTVTVTARGQDASRVVEAITALFAPTASPCGSPQHNGTVTEVKQVRAI